MLMKDLAISRQLLSLAITLASIKVLLCASNLAWARERRCTLVHVQNGAGQHPVAACGGTTVVAPRRTSSIQAFAIPTSVAATTWCTDLRILKRRRHSFLTPHSNILALSASSPVRARRKGSGYAYSLYTARSGVGVAVAARSGVCEAMACRSGACVASAARTCFWRSFSSFCATRFVSSTKV